MHNQALYIQPLQPLVILGVSLPVRNKVRLIGVDSFLILI